MYSIYCKKYIYDCLEVINDMSFAMRFMQRATGLHRSIATKKSSQKLLWRQADSLGQSFPLARSMTSGIDITTIAPAVTFTSSAESLTFDAKLLRREVGKMHKKTFNAIFNLNKRLASLNRDQTDKLVEVSERVRELQSAMEDINALNNILAVDKPHELTEEQKWACKALADKLRVPLLSATNKIPLSAKNNNTGIEKSKSPVKRKPYLTYTSSDGLSIRVGRSAADNDVLSISPEHRDDEDWWLHVSGYSGSHVVICCHDNALPKKYPNTLQEAAYLAAINSKSTKSKAPVSYTRCKNVTKRNSDPAGLVRLGVMNTSTITVDKGSISSRLDALLKTKAY